MTILSEDAIIQTMRNALSISTAPEDVESYRWGSKRIIIATDTLVEGTDVPPGMRLADVARKSIVACVSDFTAKGVRPRCGTISLVLPRTASKRQVREIKNGFRTASMEFGIRMLGGDVNEGDQIAITATLCGVADKMVARRGARVGDGIFVTGNFGHAAAGLRLLLHTKTRRGRYVDAFARPRPGLAFGISAGPHLSSSMDSSDGLAKTLHEMSRQSGKKFQITGLPRDDRLDNAARGLGVRAEELVLFGGEEYETVFTVPQKNIARITGISRRCGTKITRIGVVQRGNGVYLPDGRRVDNRGWSHFAK